jgi:hypothetical protein
VSVLDAANGKVVYSPAGIASQLTVISNAVEDIPTYIPQAIIVERG